MTDFAWKPTPAQADLIAVINDASALPRLSPERLDLTLRLLRRSRLLGRVAFRLRASGELESLPWVIRDQLTSALVVAEARERIARWELDRIAVALEGLPDVPVVALKGCAYLLAGTPNAGGRLFGDVDLMVPEADLDAVEQALRAAGWKMKELSAYDEHYYRAWAHELPPMSHPERGVELDLHHNIVMRTARLKPSAALLLEDARLVPESRFKVLAPVDMALHAMVHLFESGELVDSFRELVDIDDLLQHFGTTESGSRERFSRRVEALGFARPAFLGLRYVRRLLNSPESIDGVSSAVWPPSRDRWLMDWLVPLALWPRSHETAGWSTLVARQMMEARSHWRRMPPVQLIKHLSYKSYWRARGTGQGMSLAN